jgi:hypothetical protein
VRPKLLHTTPSFPYWYQPSFQVHGHDIPTNSPDGSDSVTSAILVFTIWDKEAAANEDYFLCSWWHWFGGRKLTQAVTGRGENKKKHVQSNPLSVRKTFRPNSHDLVSPRSTAQVREFEIDGADGTLDRKPLSCAVRSYDRFAWP